MLATLLSYSAYIVRIFDYVSPVNLGVNCDNEEEAALQMTPFVATFLRPLTLPSFLLSGRLVSKSVIIPSSENIMYLLLA
ncbi:unnamed protein product [Colias eurytheme]|nr:unnamed protein product [Colias eurytheme]